MDLRQEIVRELKKFRAPSKVARHLGLDIREVLKVSTELSDQPRAFREERYGGHGRPELQKYTVARRRAFALWDASDPEIQKARAAYEEGTHDLATGRDGDWLILYAIPLQRPRPRPNYFQPAS